MSILTNVHQMKSKLGDIGDKLETLMARQKEAKE